MVELRVINGFKGIFAKNNYVPRDIVHTLFGKKRSTPTQTSIEIGKDIHIESSIGKYINHSFVPTVRISDRCIIAIQKIYIGDEITFNYNISETELAFPFHDKDTDFLRERRDELGRVGKGISWVSGSINKK
jgi:hypothetical protein